MKRILLLSFCLAMGLSVQAASSRPNVLFIAVDDLNSWVTHLGQHPQARTPNIDRLAALGVSFSRAYCAVPACEPSRAALMGGQRPWTSGCYSNGDGWKDFTKPGRDLPAQFLKAGYYVGGAGKIYHSDSYIASDWTEYMSKEGIFEHGKGIDKYEAYFTPLTSDLKDEDISDYHIVDWCIDRLKKDHDKPFFLACGLHKPHLPFVVPRKYFDMFPREEIQLPPHREDDLDDVPPAGVRMAGPTKDHAKFLKLDRWKDAVQAYLATCAYTDMNVGRLLDALDQSAYKDNTIIVFWGDHGWSFGEKHHWRKFALWEEPTRMPYIWVVPGVTRAGGVSSRPVDLMSVYPTLCAAAGVKAPKHVEGMNILPLLKDPNAEWEVPALTTHGYMNHTVRSQDWRYIRYANGQEELYDHRQDPNEWTNLAEQAKYADVKAKLAAWLPEHNEPHKKKQQANKNQAAKKKANQKK